MTYPDILSAADTVTLEPLDRPPPAPAAALDGVLGLGAFRGGVER